MTLTDLFLIDGEPMFAPNSDIGMSFEDIDAPDSGRDEGGYMHRIMARYKVGVWSFEYDTITEDEKNYLENLFDGKAEFSFTCPSSASASTPETKRAYRSKYSIKWRNAVTGLWRNYKFNIIEC